MEGGSAEAEAAEWRLEKGGSWKTLQAIGLQVGGEDEKRRGEGSGWKNAFNSGIYMFWIVHCS